MRKVMLRRLHDDRGATAVIVTLCLVAIFAMLTLTIDVGGLLYKRRELVNGSDAAALAAAQSCAITTDTDNPEDVADQYAADNVNGLAASGIASQTNIIDEQGCDSRSTGHVTVQYSMPQRLYFAEVLGFGRTNPVLAQSTAAWGPLAGGNAVPIVLESGHLQSDCDIPNPTFDPNNPPICAFWYNNKDPMGNAAWGFMNLDQWNVPASTNCSNAGANDRSDWIVNNYPDPLTLNGNPPGSLPTYVCNDTGHSNRDWSDLKREEGQFKLFPVNDCSGQLNTSGTVDPCPATPDKYDIIGFTSLLVLHVYKGDDPLAVSPGTSGTCSKDFQPFDSDGDVTTGQNFTLNAFGTYNAQCFAAPPANIDPTSIVIKPLKNTLPAYVKCATGQTTGCDYTYDPATTNIHWIGAGTTRVGRTESDDDLHISFGWSNPGSGACVPPATGPDPNAICLVTEWRGFSVGPGPIGSGADLGTRAIRLCDLKITGSCPAGA